MFRLIGVMLLAAGCATTGSNTIQPAPVKQTARASGPIELESRSEKVVLQVSGLGCPLCATNVKKTLERIPNVQEVSVDLGQGLVTVSATAALDDEQLKKAVSNAGFTLKEIKHQ